MSMAVYTQTHSNVWHVTHNLLPVSVWSLNVPVGSVNMKSHSNISGQEGLRCDILFLLLVLMQ